MRYQAIISDMDGTILNSKDELSSECAELLIELQRQGTRLILASGRNHRKMMKYAKMLEMDKYDGYLIEVNGMAITSVRTGEREIFKQLTKPEIKEIYEVVKPYELEFVGLLDDTIYNEIPNSLMPIKEAYRKAHNLNDDYPWTAGAYHRCYDNRVGYPYNYQLDLDNLPEVLNKICFAHEAEVLAKDYQEIKNKLPNYEVVLTCSTWLEVGPKDIAKGNTLKILLERLAIDPKACICFGDGENDLSMFKLCGESVAMGNALANVKLAASHTTLTNDENGVYEYLKKRAFEN